MRTKNHELKVRIGGWELIIRRARPNVATLAPRGGSESSASLGRKKIATKGKNAL